MEVLANGSLASWEGATPNMYTYNHIFLKASKTKTRKLKHKVFEDAGRGLIYMKGGYTTILLRICPNFSTWETPETYQNDPQPKVDFPEFLENLGVWGCLGYAKQGYVGVLLNIGIINKRP